MLLPSSVQAIGKHVTDKFIVNAQYRGAVKKGLKGIGNGSVEYEPTGENEYKVTVHGEVRHPEDDKTYEFEVSQSFKLTGNRLELLGEDKNLNSHAMEQERYIIQVVPFAFLARFLPPPAQGTDPVRTFLFDNSRFDLRYRKTEKQHEIELFKDDENVGKFFLAAGWKPGNEGFEKFRIPFPREQLMVSFVVKETVASTGTGFQNPEVGKKLEAIKSRATGSED
jgi:hypothetical protein